jgi:hypothetical protein
VRGEIPTMRSACRSTTRSKRLPARFQEGPRGVAAVERPGAEAPAHWGELRRCAYRPSTGLHCDPPFHFSALRPASHNQTGHEG